ncbi:MAG: cytochrome C biogenesis protein CcmH [Gammaproteobacteria bacterium]|nr:cytochrome C biogenesis protein CcmH [Gammaproteobacteria bacterium]|tara:strand:+ start:382 stop:759 length:378 start_codon:yes stop_codon:yes gene_type:complete
MKKNSILILFLVIFCLYPIHGESQVSKKQETYKKLISELRCMVCQNQNLEESEAPLAIDLKNKIMEMINDGKNEEEIKKFLVDRYSSFILYQPPFTYQNILLWLGPFIFLFVLTYFLYKRYFRLK